MLTKAEKFAWKFLIEKGDVVDEFDSYWADFKKDEKKTSLCRKSIKSIDWNKTKPVINSNRGVFVDTNSGNESLPVITGTLVLKNGTKYEWGKKEATLKEISNFLIEQIIDKIVYDPFEE